jgi:hypothetical protein
MQGDEIVSQVSESMQEDSDEEAVPEDQESDIVSQPQY